MAKKKMLSVRINDSLINRIRNLVYWTPGATLESEISRAIDKYVIDVELKRGTPFRQRDRDYLNRTASSD